MSEAGTKGRKSLEGRTIWLTRPEGQADELKRGLEERGAKVLHLPMLRILPLEPDARTKRRILDLDRYDFLFFISSNAVRHGMALILDHWPQYPAHIRNFTVGPGTAKALEDLGLNAHYPREGMNSEALLALPELREASGKKALIVRGEGGRELLAAELRNRGAVVDYLEVYRRGLPAHEPEFLMDCLKRLQPDTLVITSAEALDNLVTLIGPLWPCLQQVTLLVPSRRLEEKAGRLGFERVSRMEGADDLSILDALGDLRR